MKLKDFDFRVWSKKGRYYIHGNNLIGFKFSETHETEFETEFLLFYNKYTHKDKPWGTLYTAWHHTLYKSDYLEIELFTGFYDRSGKKVYEGDILRFEDRGEYAACCVSYNKDEAMFVAIVHVGEESAPRAIPMAKFIQETAHRGFSVVSNIHRNLGLLEQLEQLEQKDSK